MKRHSYESENDSLYEDMKNTFFTRIKELTEGEEISFEDSLSYDGEGNELLLSDVLYSLLDANLP